MSFNKAFLQPKPSREFESLQQKYIIAPFYASIDVTESFGGTVYYRVIDLLNSANVMQSNDFIQLVQTIKRTVNVANDFLPNTVFIVTWERVFPRQRTISSTTVHSMATPYNFVDEMFGERDFEIYFFSNVFQNRFEIQPPGLYYFV